ncbi:histone H1-like [Osmerus mordax]|uniref:histone H1-like n=1 Tax=Osmerus mordax TaxID=8014 RepID=UPI00350EDCE4
MPKEKNRTNGKKRVNIKLKETIIHPRKHKVKPKQKPAKQRFNTPAKPQVKSSVKSPLLAKQPKTKSPGGRGLGKAGARRLGQLLKRAIQEKTNVTGKEKQPLPSTPVRLFKYQVQAEPSEAKTGSGLPRVSQLILRVVSQCKHRGGISMVELKHALAAGGYDVSKNNTRVNLAVKGLVRKETLVQTTGTGASGSFKLNKKKLSGEKNVKRATRLKTGAKSAGEKGTLKPKGQAARPGAKTGKPAGKSPKPAGKSPKLAGKGTKSCPNKANHRRQR